jgi:predicted PurR-regulated permease PerM
MTTAEHRLAGRRTRAAADDVTPSVWTSRRPPPWLARATWRVALIVVFVLFAADQVSRLRGLLVLLLVSFFIACAMEPIVNRLAARGWRRSRATGLVFLVLLVVLAVFGAVMGRLLVEQVRELIEALPGFTQDAAESLDERFGTDLSGSEFSAQLTGANGPIASLGKEIAGDVVGVGASVVGLFFQLMSLTLFTYYFAVDGPRLRRWLCTLLPPARQRELLRLADIAIDRTAAYFYYRMALAVLSTVFHTSVFAVVGLPSALALGLWVGVISQFVPTVGTYIAGVLPVVVALTEGWEQAVAVLVVIVVYQQIENYGISPRLSARTMNIHPAVGFGAVIAGTAILGPVGAILALPVTAIVQSFAGTYLRRHDLIDEAEDLEDHARAGTTAQAAEGASSDR